MIAEYLSRYDYHDRFEQRSSTLGFCLAHQMWGDMDVEFSLLVMRFFQNTLSSTEGGAIYILQVAQLFLSLGFWTPDNE